MTHFAKLIRVRTAASPTCIYCTVEGKKAPTGWELAEDRRRSRFALGVNGNGGAGALYTCPKHLVSLANDLAAAAEDALEEARHAPDCQRYVDFVFNAPDCSCGAES